jgi:methylenetetrahydrofolate--tRNA-(uracil-5-)-methyltransferase
MGALVGHITGGHLAAGQTFQPMNVNFGLFPDIADYSKTGPDGKRLKGKDKGKSKKMAQAIRALEDFDAWLAGEVLVAAE